MSLLHEKRKLLIGAALLSGIIFVSTAYTNCGHAVLGFADNAQAGNAPQSVNVDPNLSCPQGQAPIGREPGGNMICAPYSLSNLGPLCPSQASAYSYSAPSLFCVSNSAWDQVGSMCPVGQFLTGLSTTGAILCTPPALMGIHGNCSPGQYISGLDEANQVICNYANQPSPTICPPNTFLFDVVSGTLDCRPQPWIDQPDFICPAGKSLLTRADGHWVCQPNQADPAGSSILCPTNQTLISYSSTSSPICMAAPNPDLSHLCRDGFRASGFSNGLIQCDLSDQKGGPLCPIGHFLIGFNAGAALCNSISVHHLPSTCPAASYPVGLSNGALVCSAFTNLQYPGASHQICYPGLQNICSVSGGIGVQACNPDGQSFSPCLPIDCQNGYVLRDQVCTPQNCVPGSIQNCPITNGTGTQFCNTQANWGLCQVSTCNSNFILSLNQCLPTKCAPTAIEPCAADNGFGFKVCGADGQGYGNCVTTSCKNGFTLSQSICKDTTAPRITFSTVPSTPTLGSAATLTFSVVDNESGLKSLRCFLDNVEQKDCYSPAQLNDLNAGTHNFKIVAIDNGGNSNTKSTSWSQQLCNPGSKLACSVTNGSGKKTCTAIGIWGELCVAETCNSGYQLNQGECATLQCGVGYTLVSNQCVDKTAPTLTITSVPNPFTMGSSASIGFSASDLGSGLGNITCQLDGGLPSACSSPISRSNLSYGQHKMVITAQDQAGNETSRTVEWRNALCSPGSTLSCAVANGQGVQSCSTEGSSYSSCVAATCKPGFTLSNSMCVDSTRPTLYFTQVPGNMSGQSSTAAFVASDPGSGLGSTTCQVDNAAPVTCQSPFTIVVSGWDSPHILVVRTTDRVGNTATISTEWTLDPCLDGRDYYNNAHGDTVYCRQSDGVNAK